MIDLNQEILFYIDLKDLLIILQMTLWSMAKSPLMYDLKYGCSTKGHMT